MEEKFITKLFLTIFWSSLLIAGEDESPFCNTQPPGLTGYNQSCSNNSQCVTGHCTDSKCVCDDGATFSTCAVACVPDCNSTVTGTTGTITSPSYPQNFAAYCTWTIQGPMETYISFDLKYMNTSTVKNCSSDYLQIFDGPSASHIMYNLMCITWETFTRSTGNNMHIVFRTTGSLQFIATFNIYDRHSSLYEEGKLASPGYPLEYLNNQEFTWNLSARADKRLILNILFLETESCKYDYITVYDGATENAPSSKKVCGSGVSDVIVSTKNNLFVTFKTDSSVRYRGFYAEFSAHDIRNVILNEPQGIISSSGYPFDNLDNMIYTLTIQGKADSYIYLNILGLGEDCQYDYLRIYDGPATFSPSFGNFCSSVPPGLMVSTGNSMFVVFLKTKSDNKYIGNYGNYELRDELDESSADVMKRELLFLVLTTLVFALITSCMLLIARYKRKNQHDNLCQDFWAPSRSGPPRIAGSGGTVVPPLYYSGCSTVYITATENTDPSNEYDEIGECTV